MKPEEPMKALGENRFGGWRLIASTLLIILPAIAFSQGRPDIIWVRGGHSNSVNSVTYSPDGQLLVSGSSDRTLRLFYDQELGYTGFGVSSLAFSSDGSRFAYGRIDAVVAVATNPVPPERSQ